MQIVGFRGMKINGPGFRSFRTYESAAATSARRCHSLLDLDFQIPTDIVDENTQLGRGVAACRPQDPEGDGLVYEIIQHDLQGAARQCIPHEESWQEGQAFVLKREKTQDFNGVADEGLRQ